MPKRGERGDTMVAQIIEEERRKEKKARRKDTCHLIAVAVVFVLLGISIDLLLQSLGIDLYGMLGGLS